METHKIVIVGVGGAGCRIIDGLYRRMEEGSSLVSVNTDTQALADGKATTKIQIGSDCTRGLGSGGDPDLGRKAAMEDLELLRGLFTDASLVVVLAGLGGGTGGGAAPVVIETARKMGAIVLAFVTLPFDFEGRGKIRLADEALCNIRNIADTTFVVPNERLFGFVNRDNLVAAFAGADEVLEKGIMAIWRMLTMPSYIRIDLADLQKVAENTGSTATFAYGEGTGENRASVAMDKLMSSPMLGGGKVLDTAASVIVSLAGGPDMALAEVNEIMDRIKSAVPEDCDIRVGTVVDDEWSARIGVSLFVSEEWVDGKRDMDNVPDDGSGPIFKPKGKPRQIQIEFVPGKGRFKDVEPTVMNGEDIDVPTFVRRGIALDRIIS